MADSRRKLTIVDPHVHVWKNDPAFPWPAELKQPPKEDALPETLLGLMQEQGVDYTVIVHVIYYRWDCRYAAAAVRAQPDKFAGVCRVDPESPTAAADLDHWIAEGLHGVRLSPAVGPSGEWIKDRKLMDPIWTRAAELGGADVHLVSRGAVARRRAAGGPLWRSARRVHRSHGGQPD